MQKIKHSSTLSHIETEAKSDLLTYGQRKSTPKAKYSYLLFSISLQELKSQKKTIHTLHYDDFSKDQYFIYSLQGSAIVLLDITGYCITNPNIFVIASVFTAYKF